MRAMDNNRRQPRKIADRIQTCGSTAEIFLTFFKVGLTAFGGPIAHLGYFRSEVVDRRGWISEAAYANLVGLCQFLPGPASSQVGFGLGLLRAGPLGGIAAWAGFTLPSAFLMGLFAILESRLTGRIGLSFLHGLKLVAVPVVIQAIVAMARTLTPDARRLFIAAATAVLVVVIPVTWMQIVAIALGGLLGLLLCSHPDAPLADISGWRPGRRTAAGCLVGFVALLATSLAVHDLSGSTMGSLFLLFYRSGALVFGGGHVVLPLLRASLVPKWIDQSTFLAGYGAAQAMPGPLFTFATFLGARIAGVAGAVVSTVAIFLPGLLLVTGILPVERELRKRRALQKSLAGINAAVVGLLVAALCTTILPSTIFAATDVAIAAAGLGLLLVLRMPPLAIVILTAATTTTITWIGG